MNPKVRAVIGIILWVLAGLCLIVLVRDVSIVSRVDPTTDLGALIRGYRTGSAVTEAVALLVFLIPAYLLTRSPLTRTGPRIALGVGVVAAILLGINASYVLMAEVPRLSY
jgi:hypothetical protein